MATHQNTTKIIRSVNTSKHNFTPISNQLIQNQSLSLEAKGLIMFIISLPETWIIYKCQVQSALKMNKTKFNRVWKESVEAGYIKVIKERADKGRFNYHYIISDVLTEGGLTAGGLSVGGYSDGGKAVAKEKKEVENIQEEKIDDINNSTSSTVSTVTTFADYFNNNPNSSVLEYINN
uniref:Helix-turn-helix domain containing protein n=1 Tax=uncultured Caudovirales phage TaxID=2100421 RepID=A0A6J7X280_9CAUD|nr:hypothetical protein UFOVP385_13 [uncultured Caudovirales phage]